MIRAECQYGLCHQWIAGGNHGADRPNWISLSQLVNQQPKYCGRDKYAQRVVDSMRIAP